MILISRHTPGEGPGYLAEVLARAGLPYQIVRIDAGERLPSSTQGLAGLVFMGGPMSVNDALPWIPDALHLIREACERDVPVLGHCLGGQLISKALAGVVGPNPEPEIGWFPVDVVASALADDWLAGLNRRFEVFHWHGETFSIPQGATPILASTACPRQGFVTGRTLALQCHIEMTASMVHRWSTQGAHELDTTRPFIQSADTMKEALNDRIDALHRVADVLYGRWMQGIS